MGRRGAERKRSAHVGLRENCCGIRLDLNALNTDGRTALDAAKTLRYDSVVKYLEGKGAKAGETLLGARAKRRGVASLALLSPYSSVP